jgi:hypothetical protein
MAIELPKNGMVGAVKTAQTSPPAEAPKEESTANQQSEPAGKPYETKPPAIKGGDVNDNEFAVFCQGIDKYTKIPEHGEGVWITKDLKRRLDAIKFHSGNNLGIRALVNAALEAFLDSHEAAIAAKYFGQ